MSESSTGRITGIHTIGVPVSDQDTALRFYVGTLGFEERMDAPLPQGARWIEVAPPGSAVSVALVAAGEERPSGGESGIRFTTGDAPALHRALGASGVQVGEFLQWPGVPPMFTFRDPDGNGLTATQTDTGP